MANREEKGNGEMLCGFSQWMLEIEYLVNGKRLQSAININVCGLHNLHLVFWSNTNDQV